jgi:hypothetical protein
MAASFIVTGRRSLCSLRETTPGTEGAINPTDGVYRAARNYTKRVERVRAESCSFPHFAKNTRRPILRHVIRAVVAVSHAPFHPPPLPLRCSFLTSVQSTHYPESASTRSRPTFCRQHEANPG